MSFPNNRLLPEGSKLLALQAIERRTISDRLLEPIPAGAILTVAQDFGGGKVSVWSDVGGALSDILYLSDHQVRWLS